MTKQVVFILGNKQDPEGASQKGRVRPSTTTLITKAKTPMSDPTRKPTAIPNEVDISVR